MDNEYLHSRSRFVVDTPDYCEDRETLNSLEGWLGVEVLEYSSGKTEPGDLWTNASHEK